MGALPTPVAAVQTGRGQLQQDECQQNRGSEDSGS